MGNDEVAVRHQRLIKLREEYGVDPYPSTTSRTHTIEEVQALFSDLVKDARSVVIVGRVMSIRRHGGSLFSTLYDGSGSIQVYAKRDELGVAEYAKLAMLDVADFVE